MIKKILHAMPGPLAALALFIANHSAQAVETGLSIYPKGLTAFMSGVLPPQEGFYLNDIYYYFSGSAGREVRDGIAEFGVNTTLNADFLQAMFVTDWHFLGATFAYGGLVDYAWANLDAQFETRIGGLGLSANNNAIGDSILQPAILGWHDGDLNWNLGMNVYIPTGAYQTRQLNIGRNVWGFMPQFGFTYFDPQTGWDVSSTLVFVAMTNNTATNYQSGDILQLDWGIGKHFGEGGAWEAGLTGNIVQQVGADSGAGARLGPFKAESLGVGPGISYMTKIGSTPTSFAAQWERDFDAHNTFKGDVVVASATFVF
ncbi:MAG TPA: transporter [Rhizomicrobium sp.]|nr:transporter [Rhizomicrobium sp.]